MKFPRPSPSVFAYCKRSKTGGVQGLGTRLPQSKVTDSRSLGTGCESQNSCGFILSSTESFWRISCKFLADKFPIEGESAVTTVIPPVPVAPLLLSLSFLPFFFCGREKRLPTLKQWHDPQQEHLTCQKGQRKECSTQLYHSIIHTTLKHFLMSFDAQHVHRHVTSLHDSQRIEAVLLTTHLFLVLLCQPITMAFSWAY